MNTSNEFRKNLSVEVPNFMKDRSKEMNERRQQEAVMKARYEKIKALEEAKSKRKSRILKDILIGLGVTAAVVGPAVKYNSYNDIEAENESAGIEEIMKDEKLLEEMGTTPEELEELAGYEADLESGDLSKKEMQELPSQITDFAFRKFKNNVEKATGIDAKEVFTETGDVGTVIKEGEEEATATVEYKYEKNDLVNVAIEGWLSYLKLDAKALSPDMEAMIKELAEMKTFANEQTEKSLEAVKYDVVAEKSKEMLDFIKTNLFEKEFVQENKVLKTREIDKSEISKETAKLYSTEAKETRGETANAEYEISTDDEMEL